MWYITWSCPIFIEFCVHLPLIKVKDSILPKLFNCGYLLTLTLASILCFSSSITVFNPFLFTLYLSFNSLNLLFFFSPNSPLASLSRKLTSCLSLFISPSIVLFNLVHFPPLYSGLYNPIYSASQTLAALIKLFLQCSCFSNTWSLHWLYLFEPFCPLF